MRFLSFFTVLVLSVSVLPHKAQAMGGSIWVSSDYVQARLITALTRFNKSEPFAAGLQLKLEDGWHAYWRMPGEGGLPPELDWSASDNIAKAEMKWPVPARFVDFGIDSFGYEGSVLFPLLITPKTNRREIKFDLSLNVMVCKDICVPQNLKVTYEMPGGGYGDSSYKPVIDYAFKKLPHEGDTEDLRLDNIVLGPDALVAVAWSENGFLRSDLYVESDDIYLTAKPEITIDEGDTRRATMRIKAPAEIDNLAEALAGKKVRLTLVEGSNAIEKEFTF